MNVSYGLAARDSPTDRSQINQTTRAERRGLQECTNSFIHKQASAAHLRNPAEIRGLGRRIRTPDEPPRSRPNVPLHRLVAHIPTKLTTLREAKHLGRPPPIPQVPHAFDAPAAHHAPLPRPQRHERNRCTRSCSRSSTSRTVGVVVPRVLSGTAEIRGPLVHLPAPCVRGGRRQVGFREAGEAVCRPLRPCPRPGDLNPTSTTAGSPCCNLCPSAAATLGAEHPAGRPAGLAA